MVKLNGKKRKQKVTKSNTNKKERLTTAKKKKLFLTAFEAEMANISRACKRIDIARKTLSSIQRSSR
jgi:transcriptional regulator with PAS, ATPase and Fis domain